MTTQIATNELFHIFDARRVKATELRGLDSFVNGFVGYVKNRRPILSRLREQAARVAAIEPELKTLSSARFTEEVEKLRDLARLDRLEGPAYDRAFAVAREAVYRGLGLRPYDVQIMGAMAMCTGAVSEMATGEGKTITAAMAGAVWSWYGRPVHVITVNDYLVKRDAEEMTPIYKMMGSSVGYVIHETSPQDRVEQYRRGAVYCTSKELVADFLRDQLALGNLRTAGQTATGMLMTGPRSMPLMIPGLFRVIVDEADSLLIDEAVTPLIISNSPNEEPNADIYRAAWDLAQHLSPGRDFVIDKTVRTVDLKPAGQDRLDEVAGDSGFFRGKRRREEMVQQALVAKYCFIRDEQYLIDDEGKVQIIDEFTGRIMADRSWRHGLHQAIEVKEGVQCTADKENLARQSFQRFFRQYPIMGGMTGTAWEAAPELWQIYQRPVIRIPTNKPCIRKQLPVRMFDTMDQKYDAVVERVIELHDKGIPVLIGTRSVLSSEEVSKRLQKAARPHRVLNATQTKVEAEIVASAGQKGQITVATNMAGRGTDIKLSRGVAELGGLHVISTEPHGSYRVDRQLFGRAARQGDPGCAQMFTSAEDDLYLRHAPKVRHAWRTIGADRIIKMAQAHAERLARFNRKQVLKADEWNDQSLPF